MENSSATRLALIEMHIAVFLFGVTGLFGKLISASPVTIVAGRTAFAAAAILIGLRVLSRMPGIPSAKSLATLFLSGLVLAIHWLAFFHAIQISTVAIGLVGFATFPVFVTFLEPILYRQKLRGIDFLCALLVTAGLILVAPSFDLSDAGTAGLLWAVASGFLFAVLTLINRHLVDTSPFFVVAFYQHSSAALLLVPIMFFFDGMPNPDTLWLLLILGAACTALPQLLFIKSLTHLKAQLTSVIAGLEPVYGILLAIIFLNELPGLSTLLGAVLVFGAVILAMRAHSIPGGAVPVEGRKK